MEYLSSKMIREMEDKKMRERRIAKPKAADRFFDLLITDICRLILITSRAERIRGGGGRVIGRQLGSTLIDKGVSLAH